MSILEVLVSNKIGPLGAAGIAEGLKTNQTLLVLNLCTILVLISG